MTSTHRRKPDGSDRRDEDRRKADGPFDGTDRRLSERRSNRDRRTQPRG